MKKFSVVGAILAGVMGGLFSSTPVSAGGVVYVDIRTTAWNAKSAVAFVDKFTGTRMVLGRCRSKTRCITIGEKGNLPRGYVAATDPRGLTAHIYLNPKYRKSSKNLKFTILAHELAHANGVWDHNPRCTSLMYPQITCNGKNLPRKFTPHERQILRRN